MNKNSTLLLALALSTATGCFFPRGYSPNGNAGAGGNANTAVSASASVDGTLPGIDAGVDGTTDATDTEPTDATEGSTEGSASGTVDGGAVPAPSTGGLGDGLDATAMCTKASTCTTRVSMEVCGILDPKCLDAYHKHLDGATYEKCKAKLDRLPGIVEKTAPAGYSLPPECR